jgi:deoxyhypusine synthase
MMGCSDFPTVDIYKLDEKKGEVTIPCNSVVMAVNGKSLSFPLEKIKQSGMQIDLVGDCKQIGDIEAAVNSAAKIFTK